MAPHRKDSVSVVLPEDGDVAGPVLIVEDDASYRRVLNRTLVVGGFEVIEAVDGAQGLETAIEKKPDIIVTDWMMPRMDGLALIEAIRADSRLASTYVIVLSNKSDTDEKVQCLDTGADDYLVKDCKGTEIVARVRAGVRIRLLQRALMRQARIDGPTGLYNRSHFFERLADELHRRERYAQDLALAMIDLDDLKLINDTHGHLAGDAAIRHVGRIIHDACRTTDIVARYGGDEFAVLFLGADQSHGESVLRRVVADLAAEPCIWQDIEVCLRISFGVVDGAQHPTATPDELVHAADAALYRMKREHKIATGA